MLGLPVGLSAMRDTFDDVRYAWRQLRHSPGFTAVAVLTLALGIGANTAFFALTDALAWRRIPAAKIEGVFSVGQPGGLHSLWPGLSLADFRRLAARPPASVASIAGTISPVNVTLQLPGRAEREAAQLISSGFAGVFDLPATSGRWISSDDDADTSSPPVVISDRLWRNWFGANREIVGKATVRINLKPFTVVGVAPPKFAGLDPGWIGIDLWLPVRSLPAVSPIDPANMDAVGVRVFVRPRPGVVAARLETEIRTTLADGRTGTNAPAPTNVWPLGDAPDPRTAFASLIAVGISALILIAACANLANMLLARGAQRQSETAVRLSLGASPSRVLRLFLAETAIIAALAAVGGLAIALATLRLFDGAAPGFGVLSRGVIDLSPDYRVFLYAFGAGAIATLLVGLGTAWRAIRVPPLHALASSGAPSGLTARSGRLRTGLVAVQVTVALLFVMAAGLFWEQYRKDRDRHGPPADAQYDVDRLATARVDLELLHYNPAQRQAVLDRLVSSVNAIAGVEHAAIFALDPRDISEGLLTSDWTNLTPEAPPTGRVGSPRLTRVWYRRVSPGAIDTLGIRLIRGRDFAGFDVPGAPRVAIVSESAADDIAPGGNVIGRRMQFGPWEWLTIIGVMADPVQSADRGPLRPSNVMFVPFAQWPQSAAVLVARAPSPAAVLEPIRSAVRAVNEDVALLGVSTLRSEMRSRLGVDRAMNVLMVSQSAVALGIALLGVYGVIAHFVSTRTREFGIRVALGATPGRVAKLVIDHTIHLVLVGLLPGVLLASLSSRLIESRTFDLMPNDIPTWFEAPFLILAAGLLAGYLPARRAARVDPNVALREL